MNWSDYSRFVGDVFGAPLAIEGLLAFFLESTFLGLWIFGWDRLPKRSTWRRSGSPSIGTMLSAYFILAANSWMQHPVGYTINADTRPRRAHRLRRRADQLDRAGRRSRTPSPRLPHRRRVHARRSAPGTCARRDAAIAGVPAGAAARRRGSCSSRASACSITGDLQAKLMIEQQPMKMAAAEALYRPTSRPRSRSSPSARSTAAKRSRSVQHPGPAVLPGHRQSRRPGRGHQRPADGSTREKYGARATTRPYVPVTYWSFRLMIGFGALAMRGRRARAVAAPARAGCAGQRWLVAPGRRRARRCRCWRNSFGWIFTEMGRQPWIVFGVTARPRRGLPDGRRRATVAHLADRLHPALRGARRRRGQADAAVRPGRGCPKIDARRRRRDRDDDRPLAFAY